MNGLDKKIRKLGVPCTPSPQFFSIKVGVKGVYISRTCFPSAICGAGALVKRHGKRPDTKQNVDCGS